MAKPTRKLEASDGDDEEEGCCGGCCCPCCRCVLRFLTCRRGKRGSLGLEARRLIRLGLLARFGLIIFSFVQDAHSKVKYTDIDYEVYTDAALHVLRGGSAFDRETYRYTPLIAYLMLPNTVVFKAFGKVLFSTADVVISIVQYKLLRGALRDADASLVLTSLGLWLFNPYTATISSRGSSDSISSLCILLMLLLLERRRHALAGFWFGVAVHIRIFPVIYALPLLVHLGRPNRSIFEEQGGNRGSLLALTREKVAFCLASGLTCAALCLACYALDGQRYLDEAILYHFGRYDLAHNFSPWFFVFRTVTHEGARKALGLAAFAPQVACWVYYGAVRRSTLPFSLFMVTLSFVTLNKVVTAQYFAWYLVLLPLVYPWVAEPGNAAAASPGVRVSVALWVLAQLNWLFWAYLYEFEGVESVLPAVFASSVLFVASNAKVMVELGKSYSRRRGRAKLKLKE